MFEIFFIYLRQTRQDAYWAIVFNVIQSFFKKTGITSGFFHSEEKVAANTELLKL